MSGKRFVILAVALMVLGMAASAQNTAVTLNFSGSGLGNSSGPILSGQGTFAPYGTALIAITGAAVGGGINVAMTITRNNQSGDLLTASGIGQLGANAITGTATVQLGLGVFTNFTGSFTFSINAPFSSTAGVVNFTMTGSGTLTAPPACNNFSLSAGGQAFSPSGGTAFVNVTAPQTCVWNTTGAPSWVSIGPQGTGPTNLSYFVSSNSGPARSATITIAGVPFVVEQQASSVPGLGFIGSMPHIAAQENWTTAFTVVNKGAASALARLSLYGDPNNTLLLPLTFPQQASAPNPLLAATLDRSIAANASLVIDSAGPQTPPVQIGSAQLAGTGALDGFAIFHLIPGSQEAVVPMETRNAGSYILAFDNTGGVVLGVAIQNVAAQNGNVGIVIRDDTGATLMNSSIAMLASGHTSFVLSTQYPVTANKRGTIQFNTPAGGQISVLGIRTTPLGGSNTLTTIPALANVGTSGGSIAHIATGNGWQTTFVLVNTGTSAAQVHLKFFADVTGAPLPLPLSFPQAGAGSSTVASSVDQSLAAGASLLVQSTAPATDPAPTIGSAQLTTSGNVGGFVIFRYNPNGQEAVVPLESRTANGFIIAFDNTAGTATGIALNSVSSTAVSVPVIVRDDSGNQIASDTLNLAANGHLAFTLVSDKYAAAANIRGTIEFDTPPGGQIGALGIRIPVAHTFTTLPALAK